MIDKCFVKENAHTCTQIITDLSACISACGTDSVTRRVGLARSEILLGKRSGQPESSGQHTSMSHYMAAVLSPHRREGLTVEVMTGPYRVSWAGGDLFPSLLQLPGSLTPCSG